MRGLWQMMQRPSQAGPFNLAVACSCDSPSRHPRRRSVRHHHCRQRKAAQPPSVVGAEVAVAPPRQRALPTAVGARSVFIVCVLPKNSVSDKSLVTQFPQEGLRTHIIGKSTQVGNSLVLLRYEFE